MPLVGCAELQGEAGDVGGELPYQRRRRGEQENVCDGLIEMTRFRLRLVERRDGETERRREGERERETGRGRGREGEGGKSERGNEGGREGEREGEREGGRREGGGRREEGGIAGGREGGQYPLVLQY